MTPSFADGRISPLDLVWDHAIKDSFESFKDHFPTAMLFQNKRDLRKWAIKRAVMNHEHVGLISEFGVFRGNGISLFARVLEPYGLGITGFDSFEGLEEDWTGHHNGRTQGGFGQQSTPPGVPENAKLIKGKVQDTLPGFLARQGAVHYTFAHMDFDTYTPTAFTLSAIKDRLRKGTVLVFDELYGYPGWRHHEWKALKETLPDACYDFIAFGTESVAIEINRDL